MTQIQKIVHISDGYGWIESTGLLQHVQVPFRSAKRGHFWGHVTNLDGDVLAAND